MTNERPHDDLTPPDADTLPVEPTEPTEPAPDASALQAELDEAELAMFQRPAVEPDNAPVPDLSGGLDENRFDLDIDAALSALGSLGDVVAEQSAGIAAEQARIAALKADEEERQEAARVAAEAYARWKESYHMAHPPSVRLQRGRLASVLPALLLIAAGAYLTFALTLPDVPLPQGYVPAILCGVGGLVILSYWLTSGRWARGALLIGSACAGLAVVLAYTEATGGTLATQGAALVIVAGAAVTLTGALGRPRHGATVAVGLALALAGGAGLAMQSGVVPGSLAALSATIAPFVLGGALALAALALVLRRVPSARPPA